MAKVKGMTSIEIAVILAIVLVIAVAVGWYLYTTFTASTQAQARLSITSATFYTTTTPNLRVVVINPGPNDVVVQAVQILGTTPITCTPSGFTLPYRITVGRTVTLNMTCSGVTATPGTMIQGQVVTTAGTVFPFTAAVR